MSRSSVPSYRPPKVRGTQHLSLVPLRENQRRRMNVRGTFPPRMSCRAMGGTAVKRTKQTFVARHPSQTNTEYYSNRSGRSTATTSPGIPVHKPRALAHNIDIKQNAVPRQQSANQPSSSEPLCYATYTMCNSPMVTNTGPLTHHRYAYVQKPGTANGDHVPL